MPPYGLIFFSSLSILAFEIILIRIFSVRFSYHYAALVISISMTGLVIGGVYTYLKSLTPRTLFYVFLLSLAYPFVFIISILLPLDHVRMLWENIQVLYLLLFAIALALPFFLYGVIISSSLLSYHHKVHRIYATDLLGATGGVVCGLVLLNYLKVEHIIAVLSFILTATFIVNSFSRKQYAMTALLIIPLVLSASLLKGVFPFTISPYRTLSQALMDDGARLHTTITTSHSRLDIFENPRMRLAPGLSLTYMKEIPRGLGLAMDGEVTGVVLDEKDIYQYDFLIYMPTALPYILKNRVENVFVVGFKNSVDILSPFYMGSKNITIAEKDRSLVQYINNTFEKESIYSRPLTSKPARTFVTHVQQPFDIILLSRTGFFIGGNFGLQEDYETTVEALHLYLSRLKKDGLLFIHMFLLSPPRYELRMLNNIIAALNTYGVKDVTRHLLVFRSWDTISFLIKKGQFSEEEQHRIERFIATRQFDIIYPRGNRIEPVIKGTDYRGICAQLIDGKTRETFIHTYPFNIETTTDDRPFFHYFLKFKKIKDIYELTGKKWAFFLHEGMALPFILIFLILVSACIFLATLFLSKPLRSSLTTHLFCYFASIGLAFMFIEIFFIHKMMLPLGSPVDAFAVVLITILVSAGTGSLISGYALDKKIAYPMVLVVILLVLYIFIFDQVLRFSGSFLSIIPLGICLGFYFPAGLRFFCKEEKGLVPIAYAVNGAFSVMAPPLASLIAVTYGCTMLLVISSMLYVFSLFLLRFTRHGYKGNTA